MALTRLALLAMFMLARALPAQAQARVSAVDGTRWNELDHSVKVGYAVGFIQGITFSESLIIVGFVSVGWTKQRWSRRIVCTTNTLFRFIPI